MEEKLPTAQEIWDEYTDKVSTIGEANSAGMNAMREFASIHVEAALKAAASFADSYENSGTLGPQLIEQYPLSNIT